jgi:hypothetical protein
VNGGDEMFIRVSGSQGVIVNNYNGKYSLNSAWEGKDGKVNMNWAREQVKKDEFKEKATPIKVFLGDKESALKALREIYEAIEPGQDVPF